MVRFVETPLLSKGIVEDVDSSSRRCRVGAQRGAGQEKGRWRCGAIGEAL